MSRPIALAPLLALLVAGCASAKAPHPAVPSSWARAASCPTIVGRTLSGIALRVYDQAVAGRNVASSRRRLARSPALAAAVASGDASLTRAILRPLLRHQIRAIVVTHGGRVLARFGSHATLAPVHGVIRDPAGAPVGRYTLSVADDAAIAKVTRAVTGLEVLMRGTSGQAASTLGAGPRLAAGDRSIGYHGVRYDVSSYSAEAFPAGSLRVWLLRPAGGGARCAATAAATVADTIGMVGERLLRSESSGPQTRLVLRHVARDPGFRAAVVHDDSAALRAAIIRFFRDRRLHVVRIRARTAGGQLVGDVGGPYVLAPATRTVRGAGGRVLGTVTLSVQDDTGYIKLMHRFTGALVVLRVHGRVVPGSARIPPGGSHRVFSFGGSAFPAGRLRVSLVV